MLTARVENRHVFDPLLVNERADLKVDLARRQLGGVNRRLAVFDNCHAQHGVVNFDEPAGVISDLAFANYRVHTITSPSNGSYVSISPGTTSRIAISSDATAMMLSLS